VGKNSSPAAAQVFSNSNLCTKLATTPVFPGEPPPSNPNGTPEPSQRTRERGQKRSTCAPKTPSWGRILPRGKTDRGTSGRSHVVRSRRRRRKQGAMVRSSKASRMQQRGRATTRARTGPLGRGQAAPATLQPRGASAEKASAAAAASAAASAPMRHPRGNVRQCFRLSIQRSAPRDNCDRPGLQNCDTGPAPACSYEYRDHRSSRSRTPDFIDTQTAPR
jgi:hypothetical protein